MKRALLVAVCTGLRCQPQPRGALFQVAVSQGAPCTSPPWGSNVHGVSPRASLSHAHTTHTHPLHPITSPWKERDGEEKGWMQRVWEEEDRARDSASVFLQTRSPMGILSQMKVSKTLYLLILNFKRTLRKYIHSLLRILIHGSDTHPPPYFYTQDDGGTPRR